MTSPRRRLIGASMLSVLGGALLVFIAGVSNPVPAHAAQTITADMLFDWMLKYSNWGRWGKDDQLGTMNFVSSRIRLKGADQVKYGITVSMARRPFKTAFDPQRPRDPAFPALAPLATGPQELDDSSPFIFWANPPGFTSDRWNFAMAGVVHSHLDSLCHISTPATATPRLYPERYVYNGRPLLTNNTSTGCLANGIDNVAVNGVFTRGILFDATLLPRLREAGNPWLAPGTKVARADLEELERIEGVMASPGDVVLLYTGRWKRRAAVGPWPSSCAAPNVPPACGEAGFWYDNIPYFYEHNIAQFGADAWNDVTPANLDDYTSLPYHGFQAATGWAHYDNLDLEVLANVTRQLRRYEFLFTVAPFPVVGGITSPTNPLAVF